MTKEQYHIDERKRKQFTVIAQDIMLPAESLSLTQVNKSREFFNYLRPFIKKDVRLLFKNHKDNSISDIFEITSKATSDITTKIRNTFSVDMRSSQAIFGFICYLEDKGIGRLSRLKKLTKQEAKKKYP